MNAQIIPTNDYFHAVINEPDADKKRDLYVERFVKPWSQMMGMFSAGSDDPVAEARAWNWLLPEHLDAVPETLKTLESKDAWAIAQDALDKAVARFAGYADRMPFDHVDGWLMVANPETSDPVMRGITGATDWFEPRFVVQYDTLTDQNLKSLPGFVTHEFHHLIRLRVFPWDMANTTVADYIIHEGMAESFATSLFGDDVLGHYVTDFDDSEIETAKNLMRDGLQKTGFNVLRAYIFGDYWAEKMNLETVGMPIYGGYAIGYRVVQAYLQRTGTSIEDATFIPADDIVRDSGYFG
jgi:uncharacterized protein YjaZ